MFHGLVEPPWLVAVVFEVRVAVMGGEVLRDGQGILVWPPETGEVWMEGQVMTADEASIPPRMVFDAQPRSTERIQCDV